MGYSKYSNFDNMTLQGIDEDSELIPLLTPEDEEEMNNESLPEVLPILPLRNTVLFPGVVIPITAGRDTSINLIKEVILGTLMVFLLFSNSFIFFKDVLHQHIRFTK